jgi:hypothetical protein
MGKLYTQIRQCVTIEVPDDAQATQVREQYAGLTPEEVLARIQSGELKAEISPPYFALTALSGPKISYDGEERDNLGRPQRMIHFE